LDVSVVPTYSISFSLQRTMTAFTFVSVPVTADLMIEQPDGTGRIDVAMMVQRAVYHITGYAVNVSYKEAYRGIRVTDEGGMSPELIDGPGGQRPGV
jgi:hypothetical protein